LILPRCFVILFSAGISLRREKKEVIMAEKIVQTAGRKALGEFAPDFAHYNDEG